MSRGYIKGQQIEPNTPCKALTIGQGGLRFEAAGLPARLVLDAQTGVLSGQAFRRVSDNATDLQLRFEAREGGFHTHPGKAQRSLAVL
jgi:hypothetical protein